MSKNSGIIGQIVDRSTPQLVRGSDAYLVTQASYKGSDGPAPYKFENLTGASALFLTDTDGVPFVAVGNVADPNRGTVRFDLAATGTSLMKLGESLTFEQHFDDDRGRTILVFDSKLDVIDSIF